MKIIFNLMNCGLGNNGGSLTLIKSANVLKEQGHDVIIIDNGPNCNSWLPLKAKHMYIRQVSDIPDADAVIATGYNTWVPTKLLPERCGKKHVWVRGFELWNAPEEKLVSILSDKKFNVIVNSICLQKKLRQFDIESHIIRPGHDFDEIYPMKIRDHDKFIIGGLYNEGGKRSTKRVEWIFEAIKDLKEHYAGLSLWMFGSDGYAKNKLIDKYWRNPPVEIKNEIYNQIHLWLAPSCLEGLHIAPQEAMLTESFVVGTKAPMSGTQDYLIDGISGLKSDDNLKSFIETAKEAIHHFEMRDKCSKTGRDIILKLGDRKSNMKQLVNLLGK